MDVPMTVTEHESMNTIIHAAFRRDLGRLDAALATFPSGAAERAEVIATAWDNFAFQLHHHHIDEETIFWPVLLTLGASDALAEELEAEHVRMVLALETAEKAMGCFRRDPEADAVASARNAIAELRAVLTDHLTHEERDMEPISAAQHADPQLVEAQKAVRRAHRGNTGTLFAWLLDGADPAAVRGLRREVPRPVLYILVRTSGRRYRRTVSPVWA
jgi:hemerythrin-like domain-containing protein